jgi:hypothetical protein
MIRSAVANDGVLSFVVLPAMSLVAVIRLPPVGRQPA